MKLTSRQREAVAGYLFLMPWIIGFIWFNIGPIIVSFFLSLCKYDLINFEFIGLSNYKKFITDELFWQSLKVTSIYTFFVVFLNTVGGLLVAMLLNQKIKGLGIFRTIFYLPTVVSGIAVALLWMWVLNSEYGVLNSFLRLFGIEGPAWLSSSKWALPGLIIMSTWSVGATMLLFLAGLQSIPTSIYEASEIDGINWWQKFYQITIPMLTPTIFYVVIVNVIGSWQVFTAAFVMTEGGPNYATLFYVLYLYQHAFRWLNMGYASALAWVLFIIILTSTFLLFKSSSKWVYYEAKRK